MAVRACVLWVFVAYGFLLPACSDSEPPPNSAAAEPLDRTVDLVINEANTMQEVADALSAQTGVQFVLAPEVAPDKRLRDPYMVLSLNQNLKEHLDELEQLGIWSFRWEQGRYVIRELR